MSKSSNKKKITSFIALGLFTVIGTYNAIVINSESHLPEAKFVKRLDELYGNYQPGRRLAASLQWQKLKPLEVPAVKPVLAQPSIQKQESNEAPSFDDPAPVTAAVQEELSLNLVEVVNPKKYQQGLNVSQFSGALQTNQGVIESLSVSLPNGEGVSVSFSEMSGNVFEYDLNGEIYSGMMYQVDERNYMVTLSNGPLEGTRMKFAMEAEVDQSQPEMASAEIANAAPVETATFGDESAQPESNIQEVNTDALSANDQIQQEQTAQAEGFNLGGSI